MPVVSPRLAEHRTHYPWVTRYAKPQAWKAILDDEPETTSECTPQPCRHRLSWCLLLGRVFSIDITECPDCGGRMKIVAALTEPASIRSYLDGVGLPARPPPIAPARPIPPANNPLDTIPPPT